MAEIPVLIETCLRELWQRRGTDLILSAGTQPMMRLDGELHPASGQPILDAGILNAAIAEMLGPELNETLHHRRQVDFAVGWHDVARLRGHAFLQRGSMALALRVLPLAIPSMQDLALPPVVQSWTDLRQGLVLVAGQTGSGKSTSLASMLDDINTRHQRHIVTIEDPIEYWHGRKRGVVNQREVGTDALTFAEGLRGVLREDPDVVLIGEMRDPESIGAALTIAETGHLVFATLHTNDTAQTFDRIIDVFPAEHQPQVRIQLAQTLVGVVHQTLIPIIGGGRVAAHEVLIGNSGVRNLVREGKTSQIHTSIITGRAEGMQTLEHSLTELVRRGLITMEQAMEHSHHPEELQAPR